MKYVRHNWNVIFYVGISDVINTDYYKENAYGLSMTFKDGNILSYVILTPESGSSKIDLFISASLNTDAIKINTNVLTTNPNTNTLTTMLDFETAIYEEDNGDINILLKTGTELLLYNKLAQNAVGSITSTNISIVNTNALNFGNISISKTHITVIDNVDTKCFIVPLSAINTVDTIDNIQLAQLHHDNNTLVVWGTDKLIRQYKYESNNEWNLKITHPSKKFDVITLHFKSDTSVLLGMSNSDPVTVEFNTI